MALGNLYRNHKPPGIQKQWEKCAVDPEDARAFVNFIKDETCVDAVSWTDVDDRLRVFVADTSHSRRYTLRIYPKSGKYSLAITRIANAIPKGGAA